MTTIDDFDSKYSKNVRFKLKEFYSLFESLINFEVHCNYESMEGDEYPYMLFNGCYNYR